jgi:UDP:flavonoid glycosyltransferase YjiC (YdhE family)
MLVTSTPGAGHILPMLPLVHTLQARGHTVTWATGPDAHLLLRAAGIEAVYAGIDLQTRMRRFSECRPHVLGRPVRERRAATFPALFATLSAPPMYEDLLAIAQTDPPDVILHEPCELAAGPLAGLLGIPHVTIGFGRFVPDDLLVAAAGEIESLWAQADQPPPADCGVYEHLYLHPLPPSFETTPRGRPIEHLRPLHDHDWHTAQPRHSADRPKLYATFGTEFASMAPWRQLIDAIGLLGVDALVTVGTQVEPEMLHPLPAGVQVERWVPQQTALATADLVVSHGDAGAMIGAAAGGLPHLALPMGADQFDNGDLIRSCGIGDLIEPDDVDAQTIATAVAGLLRSDATLTRAQLAAKELAALPACGTVAAPIEQLVSHFRSTCPAPVT